MVTVEKSGKARDPYLATSASNMWYASNMSDIDLQCALMRGTDNNIAGILSRWQGTLEQIDCLHSHFKQLIWLQVYDMLGMDPEM